MMKNWEPAESGFMLRAMEITPRVCDGIVKSVGGKFALDAVARAIHAGPFGASALNHKAGDDAMKGQSVIKFFADQLFKVFLQCSALCPVQL